MVENTNLKTKLEAVDARIEELEKNIQLGKDLEDLHNDPRFQNVILNGYMDKEADRICGVLLDPSHHLKRDVMENLMDKLTAVRSIKQYFGTVLRNAAMAPEELDTEQVYRTQVTEEDSIIDVEEE